MDKRGQVAVFIILGVAIVVFILMFFLLPRDANSSDMNIDLFYNFVNSFIKEKSSDCLLIVGKNGGYYQIPDEVYANGSAYWYYEGVNIQPFVETIEIETSRCIDEVLKNSTQDVLDYFGNDSLKINVDKIHSQVDIEKFNTVIQVNYPLEISNDEEGAFLSSFQFKYSIDFFTLYETATKIVNYASTVKFDVCNPFKILEDNKDFTFLNSDGNLIVDGKLFSVFSDDLNGEPYELRFVIKHSIKESFGDGKKKLAVLYFDDPKMDTFGAISLKIFEELGLKENADYYSCNQVPDFLSKINNYDTVVITGNLQRQYVSFLGLYLIEGCNQFNPDRNKLTLKNWVNNGGVLWINDLAKYETDDFETSYLGYMGYQGGKWKSVSEDNLTASILAYAELERTVLSDSDIQQKNHYLLTCPNNISEKMIGTWVSYPLQVTSSDEIILGSQQRAGLWIRQIGNGFVVFDEFLLKGNIFSLLEYNDDLHSKGIAKAYFENVLNYLSRFENYRGDSLEISLAYPINSEHISIPIFYFNSSIENPENYIFSATDRFGKIRRTKLASREIQKDAQGLFWFNLTDNLVWNELSEGNYEWQLKINNVTSDLGFFTKNLSTSGGFG